MKIVMLAGLPNKCHDVFHHSRIVHGYAIPWGCLYCRKKCLNVFWDVQGKVKYFYEIFLFANTQPNLNVGFRKRQSHTLCSRPST